MILPSPPERVHARQAHEGHHFFSFIFANVQCCDALCVNGVQNWHVNMSATEKSENDVINLTKVSDTCDNVHIMRHAWNVHLTCSMCEQNQIWDVLHSATYIPGAYAHMMHTMPSHSLKCKHTSSDVSTSITHASTSQGDPPNPTFHHLQPQPRPHQTAHLSVKMQPIKGPLVTGHKGTAEEDIRLYWDGYNNLTKLLPKEETWLGALYNHK